MTTDTRPKTLSILQLIQADNLLQDLPLLAMLKGLKGLMVYRGKSFTDYFDVLQGEVSQLGHLQLRADVDPMTASGYLVDLAMGYERTLDDINRVTIEAQVFLGRLRVVHNKAITLKAPFMALWSIGAAEVLAANSTVKITATDLRALAASEFTGIVDEADLELAGMIEAMDLTIDNLKNLRKLAQDKYAIGKDQVNAALSALDFEDKGITGAPKSHRPAASDAATMQGMFGSRVQTELQPSTAMPALAPGEDDFPHAATDLDELDEPPTAAYVEAVSTPIPNGGIASEAEEEHFETIEKRQAAQAPSLDAELAEFSTTSYTMSEHPGREVMGSVDLTAPLEPVDAEGPGPLMTPETLVATPDGPVPVEDLKVGDTVLVIDPAGEATTSLVTSAPELPTLEKPGKGKAVVIPYAMRVAKPGHTPNVPGLLFGLGKTKLELTAQVDPTENGVYRWHGPEAPLVRIEGEKATVVVQPQVPAEHVEVKLVVPDEHKVVAAPPEPVAAPKPEPQVVIPDAKALIQDDPFISQEQKTRIITKLEEDDDFPTGVPSPEPTMGLGLGDDDDFPTSVPEPNAQAPMDDDDDFPVGAEFIDRTPKPEDALELEEKAPETPVLESAPAPEPEKPKADAAVAAPKPGGLFRSRVLPPNQTAAPAFRPSKPVEGAQVSGDGLDEVL
jgi:hypothetical protein